MSLVSCACHWLMNAACLLKALYEAKLNPVGCKSKESQWDRATSSDPRYRSEEWVSKFRRWPTRLMSVFKRFSATTSVKVKWHHFHGPSIDGFSQLLTGARNGSPREFDSLIQFMANFRVLLVLHQLIEKNKFASLGLLSFVVHFWTEKALTVWGQRSFPERGKNLRRAMVAAMNNQDVLSCFVNRNLTAIKRKNNQTSDFSEKQLHCGTIVSFLVTKTPQISCTTFHHSVADTSTCKVAKEKSLPEVVIVIISVHWNVGSPNFTPSFSTFHPLRSIGFVFSSATAFTATSPKTWRQAKDGSFQNRLQLKTTFK